MEASTVDCPTRIVVPALSGGGSFSVATQKRSYLFLWTPPVPDEEPEDDPENVWTIAHIPREAARSGADLPWTARCHKQVAWLTALRCFSEGVCRACGPNGQYVGYYDKAMAAGAIQKAWRRHSVRARAPAVLAKARVLLELRLLPPGGPLGTIDSFAGGMGYKTLANKWSL